MANKIYPHRILPTMSIRAALLLAMSYALVGIASAATYATQTNSLMTHSPLGLLIPLGIEYFFPAAETIMYYNYIGCFCLVGMAAFSGMSNESRFLIMLPWTAAALVFVGWLQAPNPTAYWGMIVALILFGAIIFVNDMNREKYGSGGPGTKVLSIAIMIMIFEASAVVMSNPTFSPFDLDTSGNSQSSLTCSGYGYTCDANGNIDLSASVSTVTSSGGTNLDVVSVIAWASQMVVAMIKFIILVLAAVFLFSVVMLATYPALAASPQALIILGLLQLVIWVVYMIAWFNWTYKPGFETAGV